ncbi:TlpA disulfide reductase family protein [Streptomyces sp. NPDC055109]|nr:TlpA family protein disulfide reductase [Streptomyces sp. SID14446]
MNVWGWWCPPCRAEAAYFNRVSKEMKSKGGEVVGMNTRESGKRLPGAIEKDSNASYDSLCDPTGKMLLAGFPKRIERVGLLPGSSLAAMI